MTSLLPYCLQAEPKGASMGTEVKGGGTREDPWVLTTPSGGSEYTAYRDESADPPALVAMVGKTEVRYSFDASTTSTPC